MSNVFKKKLTFIDYNNKQDKTKQNFLNTNINSDLD